MTRDEAIANLKMIGVAFVEPITKEQGKLIDDTFDMAIKALEGEPCEDVVSRQAVLDAITANCIWENEYNLTSSRIKKAVESLPSAQPESQWILVSERLPKYNKTVLISVKQKGKEAVVFTAQRRRRVKTSDIFECCTDYDGWWNFRIAAWDDHEVIAWMPLPEPYKVESEEEDGKMV